MRKRLAKAAKNIKSETNREYYETVRDILEHPVVRKMSEFKHHYGTSCYRHCLNVSYMNFIICKKLHLDARAAAGQECFMTCFYMTGINMRRKREIIFMD